MVIQQFVNSIFKSNTYLLSSLESERVWCIDPGDSAPILQWLEDNHKMLYGILVTHAHFDHIYGMNELLKSFPSVSIYISEYGAEGLTCDKLNGSRYTDTPLTVNHDRIEIVKENSQIELWANQVMDVWDTPGHNRDCISFYIPNMVFTGDALIPGIKVVTKTKYSDKETAAKSVQKIVSRTTPTTIIYPGHDQSCTMETCKIVVQ
ncbi:MBL fold metallo-hydrolase [Bacteroidia bacterium]|nr:MBL fold metallo-hydrolase [Bacteroidia bacterium]